MEAHPRIFSRACRLTRPSFTDYLLLVEVLLKTEHKLMRRHDNNFCISTKEMARMKQLQCTWSRESLFNRAQVHFLIRNLEFKYEHEENQENVPDYDLEKGELSAKGVLFWVKMPLKLLVALFLYLNRQVLLIINDFLF